MMRFGEPVFLRMRIVMARSEAHTLGPKRRWKWTAWQKKRHKRTERAAPMCVPKSVDEWKGVVDGVGWDLQMTLQKVWRWQRHHLCTVVSVCNEKQQESEHTGVYGGFILSCVCVRVCRINAPLPPAVIHLPSCHFPFKPWLTWGKCATRQPPHPTPSSEWALVAFKGTLHPVVWGPLTHTHTHTHVFLTWAVSQIVGGAKPKPIWTSGQVKSESDVTENSLQESEMISMMPPLQHVLMSSKNCYSAGIWSGAGRCVNGPKLLCMKLDWPWISQSHKCISGLT